MSTVIQDAIISSIAQSMNPMNAMTNQFMSAQVEQMRKDNTGRTSELIDSVAAKLLAAKRTENMPQSVITAYEKLLASLTS